MAKKKVQSIIFEKYYQLLGKGDIPLKWKKVLAGNISVKAAKIESQLHFEKSKNLIVSEFIRIIEKIVLAESRENVIDDLINSMLTIEGNIDNKQLKDYFRKDIFDDFLRRMNISMIAPLQEESYNPELHTAVGGKSIIRKVSRVEAMGFREIDGMVLKKAKVVLD